MAKKGEAGKVIEPDKIKSVDEFLVRIKDIAKVETGNFIYRGLTNTSYHLNSSATRRLETTINKKLNKEQKKEILKRDLSNYMTKLVQDAKQKGYHYKDGKELSDLELIADLQHHGCATMLMDFTKNALVALYFACKKDEKDGYVAVVDINNPNIFEKITTEMSKKNKVPKKESNEIVKMSDGKVKIVDSTTKEEIEEEKVIEVDAIDYYLDASKKELFYWEPPTLNNRIPAQHSIFVFGDTEVKKNNYNTIIIDKKFKEKILKELNRIHDINPVTLFFDLAGFAQANSYDESFTKFDWNDYFSIGMGFHWNNNQKSAIEYFKLALDNFSNGSNKDKATIYFNSGNAKADMGRQEEAIEDYDKAIELDPKDAKAYGTRGIAKAELGRIEEATEDYDKAIELDPQDAISYNNRGNAKADLGHQKEAIEDYDKAIVIDQKFAKAYFNRGIVKRDLGRHQDAIEDFNKAIDVYPKFAMAYISRGNAKADMGRQEEAIEDYDKAIELDPKDAIAYNNRGNAKDNLGRHKEAIEDYNKAIEIDPKLAVAYYGRGNAKADLGHQKEAIEDYDKAIELDPKDAGAYGNRGCAKVDLGRQEEAIEDYDKAIELDPKDAGVYSNRGIAKAELGRFDEALQDLQIAWKLATEQHDTTILERLKVVFNEDGSLKENWKDFFKKQ